jgi:hypothetical protein
MMLKICKHISHNVCLLKWIASIYSYDVFPISHLSKLISSLIILSFKHQNPQGALDAPSLILEILKFLYPQADLDAVGEGVAATCSDNEVLNLIEDSAVMAGHIVDMFLVDMSLGYVMM